MKFSYNWIKELSGTKKSAEEIAELFLTHSFEVEGIEDLSKGLDKVVVGEVLSVEKHPDADRLKVAMVQVKSGSHFAKASRDKKSKVESKIPLNPPLQKGETVDNPPLKNGEEQGVLQIVCGAPNLEAGQLVPVALVGAKLTAKDKNGQEQEFEIKKSKIRGVESSGMICAEDELGLGEDHEGIMVLQEQPQTNADLMQADVKTPHPHFREKGDDPLYTGGSPRVGQSFAEYMNLNDKILDIDILPNRGHDCLGYNGIAFELNALENDKSQMTNNNSVTNDKILNEKKTDILKVDIDTEKCSRYAGVKIKNIKLAPSPLWMQARLKASGLKAINNVVDITNYVMLETGQPLHAFSAQGGPASGWDANKILIRQAEKGEKIVLLDEQELELVKDDIVITDGEKPIALAGVMGGLKSGIKDNTKEIILEGANFDSSSIRFTARRYNLQTDAAYRFERDIDPNFVDIALSRAVELIQELADGEVEMVTDIYPEPVKPWIINLSLNYVRRLLGVEISDEEIENILKRLGITSSKSRTNADLTRTNAEDTNKFPQTKKVLDALREIKKIADEQDIKFWVLGGLACAFYAGQIYREHDDLDLITKTEEDRQKLLKLLQENGFEKIRTKKLTDKLSVDIYKNKVEVEAVIGEYLKEFGLRDDDFGDEELELAEVKSLVLSKRFIKSVKDRQLKERTKSKDQLDLDYLDVGRLSVLRRRTSKCTIPTRRRDLRTEEDLIEEVGRIYGYDKIKPKPIQAPVQTPHRNEQRFLERDLKNIAVQSGFSEIRSYSFHSEEDAKILGLDNLKHIELLNPASPEQLMLRNTLAIGLLKAGRKSLSYFPEVRIFEIGKVYRSIDKVLPEEVVYFGGAVFSKNKNGEQFYELKGLVDNLLQGLGIEDYYYDPTIEEQILEKIPNMHPSRRAVVKTELGGVIGWLGETTKQENKYFGLKNVRGALMSMNVEKMLELSQEKNSFQSLPKFPFVERDLSMVVPEKMRVKEVEDSLFKAGSELLKDVDLFDLYYNKETGERSMAFHLLFGDEEKTLQTKEVDTELANIIGTVEGELGVEVRK